MIVIDMELPKTCRSCNLSFDAYGSITEGKCAALRFGVTYMNDRRNPICPIVGEIPDKHGELCDKDKLKEATKNTEIRNSRGEIYQIGQAIAKIIDEAPTVLEASR